MGVAAVASALCLDWDFVNILAVCAAHSRVYDDPTHLAGVRILGVDEHCVRHEALLFRMEVRDLHHSAVAVAG